MRLSRAAVLALTVVSCAPPEEDAPATSGAFTGGGGSVGISSRATRPLIGGTVLVSPDGTQAVVSDPERDIVSFISLTRNLVSSYVQLAAGAQPSRATWNAQGLVQVVLRGTGEVATIDPATATVVSTQIVCPEPRGIAWDSTHQATLVACATGELVTMREHELEVRHFDADLRDVTVKDGRVKLSAFRAPRVFELDATPFSLPAVVADRPMSPTAAYRMLEGANVTIVVHQDAADDNVQQPPPPATPPTATTPPSAPIPAYYGNGPVVPPCNGAVVRSAVTLLSGNTVVGRLQLPGVLPIDAALSPNGQELVVIHAGNSELVRLPVSTIQGRTPAACAPVSATPAVNAQGAPLPPLLGSPIGVAFTPSGDLLVHSREPPALFVISRRTAVPARISLRGSTVETPGQRLFHQGLGGISCASCHPEGLEDGHVWTLEGKRRRTQSLAGGLLKTAPFHWDGSLRNLEAVLDETFVRRMGGTKPEPTVVRSLEAMLAGIPAPRAPTRAETIDPVRGRAAFEKATCTACHGGALMTNGHTMDVGSGGPLQVPSLVGLGRRGPWMHDGCARTLEERFTNVACGGRNHGGYATLTPEEQHDLVGWLGQL